MDASASGTGWVIGIVSPRQRGSRRWRHFCLCLGSVLEGFIETIVLFPDWIVTCGKGVARKQAQRPKDAVRSAGVRQLQPNVVRRSHERPCDVSWTIRRANVPNENVLSKSSSPTGLTSRAAAKDIARLGRRTRSMLPSAARDTTRAIPLAASSRSRRKTAATSRTCRSSAPVRSDTSGRRASM